MEEKKVAVIVPRLYFGGLTRVAIELLKRLEKVNGLNFTIFTTRIKSKWHEELETEVNKFSPVPYPDLVFHRPDIKSKLDDYDLIFNHNLYVNKLSRLLKTPMLSVNHTLHSYETRWFYRGLGIKYKLQKRLNQIGARNLQYADRVVCISDNIRKRTSDIYKARSTRIYHGGNLEFLEPSNTDNNFIFAPDNIGSSIERISKEKRVKGLGNFQNSKIEGIGVVSDEKLSDYYKKCSFIVSGSFSDGFGLSAVEAAFCGKPCVVRSIGGYRETVKHGETGFLAENSYEFHKYVDKLWNNPELRKEMGRNAYEHVKDRFTWENAAKKYLVEMNDLMGTDFELPEEVMDGS